MLYVFLMCEYNGDGGRYVAKSADCIHIAVEICCDKSSISCGLIIVGHVDCSVV